jgi:hypothetical protein
VNLSLMVSAATLFCVAPTLALADTYSPCTTTPNVTFCATTTLVDTAHGGMSKTNIYSWGFSGLAVPTGKVISSASISFSGIYNWDSGENRLDIDLLDSPLAANKSATGTIATSTVNSVSSDVPHAQWNDDFLHINSVTPSGTGDHRYDLTASGSAAYGMVSVGADHNSTDNTDHAANDHTPIHGGTVDQFHSFGTTGVNYTYTLSTADLAVLTGYINSGGDFAFGFNPDCHYYDSGITMQISFASAVPEPGSILLFGTVAILAARMRRRKRGQV